MTLTPPRAKRPTGTAHPHRTPRRPRGHRIAAHGTGKKPPGPVVALVAMLLLALGLVLGDGGFKHLGPRAPTPVRSGLGPARIVPAGLLGFNGEAVTGGPGVWSDPGFVSAVAALHPQALRVFGGTPANFWDWRAGTFVRSSLLTAHLRAVRSQAHVTLADWARIIRAAHATPVFDLNLLTSNLASQLAMLGAARRLGMPVTHVELGNELYLPVYSRQLPDGAIYGRMATGWIAAIKRRFPGVMVAADAFPGGDSNTTRIDARERRWNIEMLRTLRGEAALSFHAYFRSGLADGASPTAGDAARTTSDAPAHRWSGLSRVIARMPRGVNAWVTEWNLFDTRARVHRTWAQGLAVAAFGLDLIAAPRVVQADYHALVNNDMFGALSDSGSGAATRPMISATPTPQTTSRFGLYAGGVAMQALLGALVGAQSAQRLSFASEASRGMAGAVLDGALGVSAVIVNPSGEAASVVLPSTLRGALYSERWAAPGASVAGPGALHVRTGHIATRLELEPFSLVRIGREQ